jgi:uncharacterized protein YcgL (UPF0745 family)
VKPILARNHSNYLFFDNKEDQNSIRLHLLEKFFKFVTYIVIGDNLDDQRKLKDIEYLGDVIKTHMPSSYQIILVNVSGILNLNLD